MTYTEWLPVFKRAFLRESGFHPDDMADHDYSGIHDEYPDEPKAAAKEQAKKFLEDPFAYDDDIFCSE